MKDREKIIEAMAERRLLMEGFSFTTDPSEGGQDLFDMSYDAILDARTALSSLEAELSSRGLAILPVEATEEMIEAGDDAPWAQDCFTTSEIYRAMTAAYLKKD